MSQPKLIDQLRSAIRIRNYSPRTEEPYWHWIKKFILFHNKRHQTKWANPRSPRSYHTFESGEKVTAPTLGARHSFALTLLQVSPLVDRQ